MADINHYITAWNNIVRTATDPKKFNTMRDELIEDVQDEVNDLPEGSEESKPFIQLLQTLQEVNATPNATPPSPQEYPQFAQEQNATPSSLPEVQAVTVPEPTPEAAPPPQSNLQQAPKTIEEISTITLNRLKTDIDTMQKKDELIHQAVSQQSPNEKDQAALNKIEEARANKFGQVDEAIKLYEQDITNAKTPAARKDVLNQLQKNVSAADNAYKKKIEEVTTPELNQKFSDEFKKNYKEDYSKDSPLVTTISKHNNINNAKLQFESQKSKLQNDLTNIKDNVAIHKEKASNVIEWADDPDNPLPNGVNVANNNMYKEIDAAAGDYENALKNAKNNAELQAATKDFQTRVNAANKTYNNEITKLNLNDKQMKSLNGQFDKEYPGFQGNSVPAVHDINNYAEKQLIGSAPETTANVGTVPDSVKGYQATPGKNSDLRQNTNILLMLTKDGWENNSEKGSEFRIFENAKLHAQITIGKDTISGKCTGSDADRKAMYEKMADSMVAAGYKDNGKEVVLNVKDEKNRKMFEEVCKERGLAVKGAEKADTITAEKKSAVTPPQPEVVAKVNPDAIPPAPPAPQAGPAHTA